METLLMSAFSPLGWSPWPAAVADPTDISGVAVEESLVSSGPNVVPAPLAALRGAWSCEADMVIC